MLNVPSDNYYLYFETSHQNLKNINVFENSIHPDNLLLVNEDITNVNFENQINDTFFVVNKIYDTNEKFIQSNNNSLIIDSYNNLYHSFINIYNKKKILINNEDYISNTNNILQNSNQFLHLNRFNIIKLSESYSIRDIQIYDDSYWVANYNNNNDEGIILSTEEQEFSIFSINLTFDEIIPNLHQNQTIELKKSTLILLLIVKVKKQ